MSKMQTEIPDIYKKISGLILAVNELETRLCSKCHKNINKGDYYYVVETKLKKDDLTRNAKEEVFCLKCQK